jgi:mutator protein MutT
MPSDATGISTAALIRRGNRILLVRRGEGGDLGGCWELPGGKTDPGERPEEALKRELREELGVEAVVGPAVGRAEFDHRGRRFTLIGYEVALAEQEIELIEHEASGYYTVAAALRLRLAPSDASLLRSIRGSI